MNFVGIIKGGRKVYLHDERGTRLKKFKKLCLKTMATEESQAINGNERNKSSLEKIGKKLFFNYQKRSDGDVERKIKSIQNDYEAKSSARLLFQFPNARR